MSAAMDGQNMGEAVKSQDFLDLMQSHERNIFDSLLHPDDCYTPEGTYWLDLPWWQRVRFVASGDSVEFAREFKQLWQMFKNDPLEPARCYFRNAALPGAGLFLEGYILFSIGNLKPLFAAVWPNCWGDPDSSHRVCNETWTASVEYLEISGIIFGQMVVGFVGDWIGRRWGLIQDAAIMCLGLVMLTASWGVTMEGFVICYAWSLFVYGIGLGGEYPMTATSGMENAVGSGRISTRDDRLHRGRKVTGAFSMQGWGQFSNQAILILSLLCFHHGSGNAPYSTVSAQWTFRLSFAIPALFTLWLVYFRSFWMKDASKQLINAKRRANVSITGYDTESLKLTCKHFGGRLWATSMGWFANDVFFFGNKLFQNEFMDVLTPHGTSIMPGWLYNLINVGVSLVGYYLAVMLIDNKLYGRRNMQVVGFMMCFILFVIPAFKYNKYTSPEHIKEFQAMYFLSSFFSQFGANCVTFLVAAEVFPTAIRASAHGLAASMGKVGALLASVFYNYIDTQTKFYVVPWFGLGGMIITLVWLPDTTGLDLKEQERRWMFIRQGRDNEYHGVAIHPKHLSLWERWMGVGANYNPPIDFRQKVEEMREEWREMMSRGSTECDADGDHEEELSATGLRHPHVHEFFHRTSPQPTVRNENNGGDNEKSPTSVMSRSKKASHIN